MTKRTNTDLDDLDGDDDKPQAPKDIDEQDEDEEQSTAVQDIKRYKSTTTTTTTTTSTASTTTRNNSLDNDDDDDLNDNNNNNNNNNDEPFTGEIEIQLTEEESILASIQSLVEIEFDKTLYKQCPPFILQSHLYYVEKNKSKVDKNLKQGKIRVMKLLTGQNDYGILMTSDYIKKIESLKLNTTNTATSTATQDHHQQPFHNQVLDQFINLLIPSFTDVSIFRSKLQQILQLSPQHIENAITILVQSNLLLLNDDGNYLLNVPGSGGYITNLSKDLLISGDIKRI
ncbi:putative protein serine/threonine kinase [Cavenderia fasciculata]|uniref:Uncharacterized protein n=1 Tax=Cavenderia fasciculata TaxID=261658 RepID=F4PVK2_CACFS|nr:putative protein serine/threonine kinase [Cavenderia fasciculata]EGG20016.1 putative protein serine/threonine kinase [Cavenderia fasciculata]|eukprot:XP_004366999.1 putative protein serine/threonine kinase [Cavenderia fasciculata]